MAYAIIRLRKLKKKNLSLTYRHNKRLNKSYRNKSIDDLKTKDNYSLKETNGTFYNEIKNIISKNNVKCNLNRDDINIGIEYVITASSSFFKNISQEETKRYFKEGYNFVCNYRNLGEKYIISADVHMDEENPHMHLIFMPVVHDIIDETQNKKRERLSFRDFMGGIGAYKDLQDKFYNHVKDKGFDLQRGNKHRSHIDIEVLKEYSLFYEYKALKKETEKTKRKYLENKKIMKEMIDVLEKNYGISKEEIKDKVKKNIAIKINNENDKKGKKENQEHEIE